MIIILVLTFLSAVATFMVILGWRGLALLFSGGFFLLALLHSPLMALLTGCIMALLLAPLLAAPRPGLLA